MISFCVPSRGRPELAKRLVDTANNTAKYQTEFLFYLNDDDPKLEEYRDLLDEKHYTIGPNQSTCFSNLVPCSCGVCKSWAVTQMIVLGLVSFAAV